MSELANKVRDIVGRHIATGAIGGGVVLIARKGQTEVLEAQGVCDFDPACILKTDSVFGVMSMTKPVVAAAAMILVSEGRLSPSDSVARWIPEFGKPRQVRTLKPGQSYPPFVGMDAPPPAEPEYDYSPAVREITINDIMNFTSGLQTIGVPNAAIPPIGPDDTVASWVAKLGDAPLEFQPGSRWHYSNATGYEVLARLIEVASGQPFPDFIRERLFEPLGMAESCFGVQSWIGDRLVPLGPLAAAPVARPDYASGSAGMFSTAQDYARFAQMLLDGGRFDGRQVMSADAVATMKRNQIGDMPFPGVRSIEYAKPIPEPKPGLRYGYGVAIVTDPWEGLAVPAGSFGWDGVGTRRFWVMPKLDAVLIMLMPGLGSGADAAHQEIEAAVSV